MNKNRRFDEGSLIEIGVFSIITIAIILSFSCIFSDIYFKIKEHPSSLPNIRYTITVYDGTKLIKTYKRVDGWYRGNEDTVIFIGDDVLHIPNKYIIEKYRTK